MSEFRWELADAMRMIIDVKSIVVGQLGKVCACLQLSALSRPATKKPDAPIDMIQQLFNDFTN